MRNVITTQFLFLLYFILLNNLNYIFAFENILASFFNQTKYRKLNCSDSNMGHPNQSRLASVSNAQSLRVDRRISLDWKKSIKVKSCLKNVNCSPWFVKQLTPMVIWWHFSLSIVFSFLPVLWQSGALKQVFSDFNGVLKHIREEMTLNKALFN